jgi:thiamine-phosphate pyrophosphorylase
MSVLRIIDANANRAREALRVMEEAARFTLDDRELTALHKALRHDLAALLRRFGELELHRDTPGDVGTAIGTAAERTRESVADVARAAGRRLGEALRALEEYGKTLDADFAGGVERIRYRAYEAERRLLLALGGGRAPQWRVCVILGEASCAGRPWENVARSIVAAQPDCIQLREKDLDDGELLARARALREMTRGRTALVVNDRPDVALLAGADGVHLGQGDLPCADVRRLVGREMLLGVSTSSVAEARRARADGADYCGIGPMFPSPTKHKERIAGPAALRAYRAWDGLPHLAIGGITPERLNEVIAAGGLGIAVSSGVCAAPDPGAVVRELMSRMQGRPGDTHPVSGDGHLVSS